jgi:hypothetical protein
VAEARKQLPQDGPQLAGFLSQVGLPLLEKKRWVEAVPLLRGCLTVREKTHAEEWTTFNAQPLLGQTKHADAEPLLLKGYGGMKAREKTIPRDFRIAPGRPT